MLNDYESKQWRLFKTDNRLFDYGVWMTHTRRWFLDLVSVLKRYKGSFLFVLIDYEEKFLSPIWSWSGVSWMRVLIISQSESDTLKITCLFVQVTTNWQTLEGVTLFCSVFIVKRLRSPYTLSIRSKSILVQDIRHKFGWFYFSIKLVIFSFLH